MDPNANLEEQLYLSSQMKKILDGVKHDGVMNADERADLISKGLRLTELIEALDHWITGGGFLPSRWTVSIGTPGGLYVGKDR